MYRNNSPELSVRADPKSEHLSYQVKERGVLYGNNELVILIHGYNVDESEARASYRAIKKNFREYKVPNEVIDRMCQFFWPGNAANPVLSALGYPLQITKARESAKMLSEYLSMHCQKYPLTQLIIIAHSLGCRLTLNLITEMVSMNSGLGGRIKLVALMAAAVPVYMMQSDKYPIYKVRSSVKSITGLFSEGDTVLHRYFPTGQTAALEGFFPVAVGRYGDPTLMWSSGFLKTYIDHGEYWSNKGVAQFLARAMNFATPRKIASRGIARRHIGK